MKRYKMKRSASRKQFTRGARRVNRKNMMNGRPMRGGFRL